MLTRRLEQRRVVADHHQPALGGPSGSSRSQTIESASRWLVGSSSSSVSAPENRIRASSTRRRWPPDRVRSGWPRTPVLDAEAGARSGRPRPRRRTRRRRAARRRPARTAASPRSRTVGSSLPISASASRSRRTTSSRPRADRIRSRASTSGSPVRGSCGQVADVAGARAPCPAAGSASPARMRVRVVLPAPLRPTRPTLSPGADPEGDVLHQQPRARRGPRGCWAVIIEDSASLGPVRGTAADARLDPGTRRKRRDALQPEGPARHQPVRTSAAAVAAAAWAAAACGSRSRAAPWPAAASAA